MLIIVDIRAYCMKTGWTDIFSTHITLFITSHSLTHNYLKRLMTAYDKCYNVLYSFYKCLMNACIRTPTVKCYLHRGIQSVWFSQSHNVEWWWARMCKMKAQAYDVMMHFQNCMWPQQKTLDLVKCEWKSMSNYFI